MTKKKKPGSSKDINETRLSVNFEKTTKEHKITEEEKRSALHDLGERVKELNCLYDLSKLVERSNISLEEIYQGAADLIPPSWQYPDIACARIVIENKEFKTPNFKVSKYKQSADIRVYGKIVGAIHVHYLKKKPDIVEGPFLKEERDLLDAIAERLGRITERKKGKEALLLSEERYKLAQRAANIGSWDWDILTGDLIWSDTIEPLFGFSKGKFRGTYEAFLDCVHPEDLHYVIDSVNACVELGKDYAIEHRIIWPDGTVHWVSETGDVIRDEKGKATRMLGIVQDITDRKKAEEVAKLAYSELDQIFNTAADGMRVVDKNFNILRVNETFLKLLDLSEDEVMGKKCYNVFPGPQCRTPRCPLVRSLSGEERIEYETEKVRNDGTKIPCIVTVTPFKRLNDELIGIVEDFKDITERKKMEEELQKSHDRLEEQVEERTAQLAEANKKLSDEIIERKKAEKKAVETKDSLQNVINCASEIIISFDKNNRVTTWNKTAELLTGYKQREIINRSVNKLSVFDNSQNVLDDIKNAYNKKKHGYDDLVLITKENTKKIIRLSGSCIEDDNKQCIGTLFIGKDITRDIDIHGKLLEGNSYLIPDKNNTSAIDLFVDLTTSGYNGLFITRANPELVKSMIPSSDIQVALLSQKKLGGFENIPNPDALIKKIEEFSMKNRESVILLDGIHYLLTRFSFEKFIEALFQINEMMVKNKSILFTRFDPSLVDINKMAIIENELQVLPSQKIEGLIIEDVVYDTLKFIHEQNQNNVLVSFKKIMAKFNIAYVTAAKRLGTLETKGLVFTKRHGKLRTVYISEKGKTLLHKRQTA
jgi:PAS domain S-box-containing protein